MKTFTVFSAVTKEVVKQGVTTTTTAVSSTLPGAIVVGACMATVAAGAYLFRRHNISFKSSIASFDISPANTNTIDNNRVVRDVTPSVISSSDVSSRNAAVLEKLLLSKK